ncbi:MAG: hypothetical protein BGO69_03210 [Bacteroidetes bacterium 46-16]|nr:MAG: hypothetical protein BGO69_03210 [Bacteroidetes bacterium 46-16]
MHSQSFKKDLRFTCILILVHFTGFLLAMHYTRIYMGDSFEYIYEAVNIKHNFFFYSGSPAMQVTEEYMTQRQPLYPFFLLAVYVFGINNWVVLLLQNIVSVFNVYLSRELFVRLGYNKKYDWLLLLFVITYPAQIIYANTIAPDILLQTFVVLYVYYFVLLIKEKKSRYGLYMSLALIAGLFVKPVLYPFAAVHIILLGVFAYSQKRAVMELALASLLPICAVLLYNTWNYERTGKFHFSSNQAFNALYYYYLFERDHYGAPQADSFLQAERARITAMPGYRERYDYANARGSQLLKNNFVPYSLFHLKNSLRYFIEPGKAEIDLFTGKLSYGKLYSGKGAGFYSTWEQEGLRGMPGYFRNNPSMAIVIIVLLFNCIRIAGTGLIFFNKRIPSSVRFFLLLFICYFAATTGPIANTRYFLPLSLLVSGCAAMSYQNIIARKQSPANHTRGTD